MWYVTARGTKKGPVTESQLRSLIQAGDVVPDDMVWKKGMMEWENVTIHFGDEFGPGRTASSFFGDPDQPPPTPNDIRSNPYASPLPPDQPVRSYTSPSDLKEGKQKHLVIRNPGDDVSQNSGNIKLAFEGRHGLASLKLEDIEEGVLDFIRGLKA